MLLLGTDGEGAALVVVCCGTAGSARTQAAIARRELDLDHLTLERQVVPAVNGRRLAQARFALGTGGHLPLPVNLEIDCRETSLRRVCCHL